MSTLLQFLFMHCICYCLKHSSFGLHLYKHDTTLAFSRVRCYVSKHLADYARSAPYLPETGYVDCLQHHSVPSPAYGVYF